MSFWLTFGAKKVPKMDPKSQLLKIIFTFWVHKMSTLGLMGHFRASCATSGHFGSIWGPFWVDFGLMLVQFWGNVVAIYDFLGEFFMICWIRRYVLRGTTKKRKRAKRTIKVLQILR